MRLILSIMLCTGILLADEAAYNRGEMLFFSKACSSCHGPAAEGSTTYPRLANKKSKYLRQRLINFRDGEASSVSQQMMAQFVNKLSDKNIDDLVYFFSHHKGEKIDDVEDAYLGGVGS